MSNLKNRVAIVTGASRGAGKGIARELIAADEAATAARGKICR